LKNHLIHHPISYLELSKMSSSAAALYLLPPSLVFAMTGARVSEELLGHAGNKAIPVVIFFT